MQRRLIVEEFKEFLDAENQLIMGLTVNSTECLKELADLVYVCVPVCREPLLGS
jgi:hypothetical protein